MSDILVGAQLYTVRDYTKTPEDIAKTCKRVREMGYDGVQLSALGPIEPVEMKKILDGEGLKCAATHVSLDRIQNEMDKVIEEHQLWDCKYTAIGGFFDKSGWTAWENFKHTFSLLAKEMSELGVQLGYHNHDHEFVHWEGRPILQWLIETLDASVWFEIDTYWVQAGGGDPADWIERATGRIPCIHVKDMAATNEHKPIMCEVGSGNLNWKRIRESCHKAGVEWYLVERDSGLLDPFESLQISLNNIRQWE